MYHKIVNKFDVDCLEVSITQGSLINVISPEVKDKVIGTIREAVTIFDEYYGAARHPESDLGGFLIFIPSLSDKELFYNKILNYYNLDVTYAEIDEELINFNDIKFRQQTFLVSSDYGIVIVYPE